MHASLRFVGYAWAAPYTLLGLTYVLAFSSLGWYVRVGTHGDALVWRPSDRMPAWLASAWARWNGHTVGNVVVMKPDLSTDRGRTCLRHEQEHVRQYSVLGPFFVPLYLLSWLTIRLACPRSNPYHGNPLEVEARRAAGQVVDVEGTVEQIRSRLQASHRH